MGETIFYALLFQNNMAKKWLPSLVVLCLWKDWTVWCALVQRSGTTCSYLCLKISSTIQLWVIQLWQRDRKKMKKSEPMSWWISRKSHNISSAKAHDSPMVVSWWKGSVESRRNDTEFLIFRKWNCDSQHLKLNIFAIRPILKLFILFAFRLPY